jgi:hypothetical protein
MSLIILPKRNQGGVGNSTFVSKPIGKIHSELLVAKVVAKRNMAHCSVFPIFLIFNEEILLKSFTT